MQGRIIAYLLIGIGAIISLVILLLYLTKTSELNSQYPIDINIFSSLGSVIGGIVGALFSLAGIFLLINTLKSQENAISLQQANFEKQLFESKFFDLLKIHRENSSDINVNNKSGREGFLYLQKEFSYCKKLVEAVNEPMSPDYKLEEDEIINISYLCFFYGAVSETSKQILKEKLSNYEEYQKSIFDYFKEKLRSPETKKNFPYTPFQGHQSSLGHYFRHLFQAIKFVDEQQTKLLSYRKKYDYVKILRAQLSTEEQAFLFYNSLSDLGQPWERLTGVEENKKLITKYNLIKNIPMGYTLNIDVRKYYPNVTFEGDILTENRKKLEESYS